jgi:hypothetical protein
LSFILLDVEHVLWVPGPRRMNAVQQVLVTIPRWRIRASTRSFWQGWVLRVSAVSYAEGLIVGQASMADDLG